LNEKERTIEKEFQSKNKNFMGYFLPTNSLNLSMTAIFAALICVLTMIIAIPIALAVTIRTILKWKELS